MARFRPHRPRRNGQVAAQSKLKEQCDELATTVKHMKAADAAVPAMLDKAEHNYLAKIDDVSPQIQETYRQTLDDGFKGMAVFVAACALMGLIVLVPYRDKRRKGE